MKYIPIIQLIHISKIYNTEEIETVALDDITFGIHRGEFVAIMGPSGSGKSTLMNIIGGLDLPTSGEYILEGENVEKLQDDALAEIRNRKIGFVFQSFNLLPRATVFANVILPMRYSSIPIDIHDREAQASKYIALVGLADRINFYPNQLSGGQQQRVAVARALVMDPSIILADEPTGNVASNQAAEIMHIFQNINKQGHTIVMITHESDIAAYAGRIIQIRDGQLIRDKRQMLQKSTRRYRLPHVYMG